MALLVAMPLAQVTPEILAEAPPTFDPLPAISLLGITEATSTSEPSQLVISLPELIELVVTGNRDLRGQQLQRLVEQQELREAEQQFDPRFTPAIGVSISQRFEEGFLSDGTLPGTFGGDSSDLGDRTTLTQSAGLLGELTTRQGTEIEVTLDTLGNTPITMRFAQPLLRGAGRTVNQAPVDIARLIEAQNFLELQQILTDTISTAVTQYTSLIQAQESVGIQQQALERRRQRLAILTALVDAGRSARVDLVDARRSIADAERDLLLAQTQLDEANTALLDLVGSDLAILFIASADTIAELAVVAEARVDTFDLEKLVALAYQRRPDYLQTELEQQVTQLNLLLAEDDLRWQLNLEGNANLGDFPQTTIGLVARRTFDETTLETELTRSRVATLQSENSLAQQQTSIRNEVANEFNTVRANLARVEAAKRATENADLQLEIAQELFRRGRSGADIFQIITQEDNLVQAQSQQLVAEIEFLNSVVNLDQAVGLTLNTWNREVDLLPVLMIPGSGEESETNMPELMLPLEN